MHLDELKHALTSLADEMQPFEGDVRALDRRDAAAGSRCRRSRRWSSW